MSMRPIPCLPPISFSLESRDAGESSSPLTEAGSPETIPISIYLCGFGSRRNKCSYTVKQRQQLIQKIIIIQTLVRKLTQVDWVHLLGQHSSYTYPSLAHLQDLPEYLPSISCINNKNHDKFVSDKTLKWQILLIYSKSSRSLFKARDGYQTCKGNLWTIIQKLDRPSL